MSSERAGSPSASRGDIPAFTEWWALLALSVGLVPGVVGLAVNWANDRAPLNAWPALGLSLLVLVAGWRLAYGSPWWSRRQKLVACVLLPFPLAAGLLTIVYQVTHFSMQDEDAVYVPPWQVLLVWAAFLSSLAIPTVVAFYLGSTAGRRRRSGQPRRLPTD